ncbi:MAG: hypothetical protein U0235_19435 [Polyangiaceae bacterium]
MHLELGGRVLALRRRARSSFTATETGTIELSLDGAVVDVERAREHAISARLAQRGVRVRSFDVR